MAVSAAPVILVSHKMTVLHLSPVMILMNVLMVATLVILPMVSVRIMMVHSNVVVKMALLLYQAFPAQHAPILMNVLIQISMTATSMLNVTMLSFLTHAHVLMDSLVMVQTATVLKTKPNSLTNAQPENMIATLPLPLVSIPRLDSLAIAKIDTFPRLLPTAVSLMWTHATRK